MSLIAEIVKLAASVPPEGWLAVRRMLQSILAHDKPEDMVRHAEVLAAKAELGLLK